MNKIKNEKGETRTNMKEIQEIIKEYFKNLYSITVDNIEEMDKFLKLMSIQN
jgi:formylmethanofuran dehydrogenase subunit A